jgi:hypothetical protein
MTGGRRGRCATPEIAANRPGYGTYGDGRGMGFRRGFGRRRGRGFGPAYAGFAPPASYRAGEALSGSDEIERLRAEAEAMQQSLEAVRHKIAELEKPDNA